MTTRPIVTVTRKIPGTLDVPGAEIRMGPDEMGTRSQTLAHVAGASVAVTMFSDRVDGEFLDAAGSQIRGICNFAVGTDNIDFDACRSRGVVVTNTPDAVTEGTADLAWTLILAVARRLIEADRYARSEAYPERGALGMADFLGQDLTGKTILIVGAGRIGRAVALRSLAWGMRVLYVARSQHLDFELAPLAAERVELDDGLARADVVSLHTPLTPETRHLLDARRLGLLKPEAIVVNTARGPVIDEAALAVALAEGRLWGAGLDVFEHEPSIHPDVVASDRAVLTPHIGSAEIRFREMMTAMVGANVRCILANENPPNQVDLGRAEP